MATRKRRRRVPWNKHRIVGQKAPLKLRESGQSASAYNSAATCDVALFNLAIDSKLRACDLLNLRVADIAHDGRVSARAVVKQRKRIDQCNSRSLK